MLLLRRKLNSHALHTCSNSILHIVFAMNDHRATFNFQFEIKTFVFGPFRNEPCLRLFEQWIKTQGEYNVFRWLLFALKCFTFPSIQTVSLLLFFSSFQISWLFITMIKCWAWLYLHHKCLPVERTPVLRYLQNLTLFGEMFILICCTVDFSAFGNYFDNIDCAIVNSIHNKHNKNNKSNKHNSHTIISMCK